MSSARRRVAITGAAGYVGRGLVERLEREDSVERILAMDVRPPGGPHGPKVVFRIHDVTAPMAEMLEENGIDAVVHLAFLLNPSRDRAAAERVNVGGASNVLEACRRAGVRQLVYLSSTTVYGAHADNPPLLSEKSPIRPVKGFQYGEHKANVEELLARHQGRNPDFTVAVLRGCPVMGPNADNFISRAFSQPFLVGIRGSDPPMQLIHEDDQTDLLTHCLLQRVSGVYNVAGDGVIRWSAMARLFGKRRINLPAPFLYGLTGLTWKLRLQGYSPACGLDFIRYPPNVSCDKVKSELGVSFRYSSEDAWMAFVQRQRERA
ncbi:MAG: SDR family oxidoreductase [SAR202 cluster bacterium]|nr:SDR family oxidoreductase [SAR202 cluster bacterium]